MLLFEGVLPGEVLKSPNIMVLVGIVHIGILFVTFVQDVAVTSGHYSKMACHLTPPQALCNICNYRENVNFI